MNEIVHFKENTSEKSSSKLSHETLELNKTFKPIPTFRWIATTLLVLIAIAVMVRLGIWQLDRLEKRREFNAHVITQINQPMLDVNTVINPNKLVNMEYRQAQVIGEYDHSLEIALRNQYWNNQWGVHLITPMKISGSNSFILVDRGWIPAEEYQKGDWSKFSEAGTVKVKGLFSNITNEE